MVAPPLVKKFLGKHPHIFLDTGPLIYFVEHHHRYHPLCEPIFEAIEVGKVMASTSTLTLLETLVQPYRRKLDDLVLKFYSLLTTYPNLHWIDLTMEIADAAARLRGEYNLKTPDAIQVASALTLDVTGFICNDVAFKKVKELECLILDDCFSPT